MLRAYSTACRREQGWGGAQGPCLTIGVGLVKLVVVLLGSSLHPQGSPLQGRQHTQGEPLPLSEAPPLRSVAASSPITPGSDCTWARGSGEA